MSSRSLNKVQLIGNLTRDPELRYTPQGTAVCSFGMATNRSWTTDSGDKKESTEFHRIVSWNKLAELCSQLLQKGRKVFVGGRLSTRNWTGADGNQRTTTEVVIDDMILLDRKPREQTRPVDKPDVQQGGKIAEVVIDETGETVKETEQTDTPGQKAPADDSTVQDTPTADDSTTDDKKTKKAKSKKEDKVEPEKEEKLSADDIPF